MIPKIEIVFSAQWHINGTQLYHYVSDHRGEWLIVLVGIIFCFLSYILCVVRRRCNRLSPNPDRLYNVCVSAGNPLSFLVADLDL